MKNCFYLLLLFSFFGFGQSKEEIEELMNVAYKEIVPEEYTYFNLVDSSKVIKFDKYALRDNDDKIFLKQYPDFNKEEFIAKAIIAKELNWKDYNIQKVVVKAYGDFPRYAYSMRVSRVVAYDTPQTVIDSLKRVTSGIVVPIKNSWSKKRVDKEVEKKWQEYDAGFKPEDKSIYKFYTPLFSNDKLYAIVRLDGSGHGKSVIFKKVKDQWVKVYVFDVWVS